ncbi:RAM signaling pathway, SOG2 [Penicillium occitanis (nom. inval.)]|nr:hypothetical protein PENOC_105370 [Penicillium occitanis (nom. inval.)]PCG96630.1 RAM signaling pathway, SOG2 [Penicillium occitanis (nom. inval.)]
MFRLEDTVKLSHPLRSQTSMEDDMTIATTTPGSSFSSAGSTQSAPSSIDDEPDYIQQTAKAARENSEVRKAPLKQLTPEETIELTRQAVENGIQETKRSLAGSEGVSDVVRPKLTIDLGHSYISQIPEGVVDLIKDEVERHVLLSLSNNQLLHIPYRFAECAHLRYLNIRANNFREFPKGIYKLPLLEILDLSRNKISRIPDEVRKLTSLRVFSIMQNRLDDLPAGLADMNKLQIVKVSGNFLKYPLRRVLENKESEVASLPMSTNEKEALVTAELKRFLKTRRQSTTPEPESGSEASEPMPTIDTPKPMKRGGNSRFPVIPSTSDGSSDPRSPNLSSRPPPIPLRSHQRLASGQSSFQPGFSRPGIAPVPGANERNRSNSEGIIPLSARNKRMATCEVLVMVLFYEPTHPADEMAALLPVPEVLVANAGEHAMVRLDIHSHMSTLINVIKGDDARRHSLEIVFYNASTHVEQLNEALETIVEMVPDNRDFARISSDVKRECVTCLMAYTHVGSQLRQGTRRIVEQGDPRYVRSLMLVIYSSLLELRNACISLGASSLATRKGHETLREKPADLVAEQVQIPSDSLPAVAVTPTRELTQPARRFRSDTMIQHPQNGLGASIPNAAYQAPTTSPGATTPSSATMMFGSRSRSNSRATTTLTSTAASSLATPRSGESFPPIPTIPGNRINPVTGLDEFVEEQIFEKIFKQLTAAYNAALHALPSASHQFSRCLEIAETTREPEEIRIMWNNLIRRCNACFESSEALGQKLLTMKVKEPGGGSRNQKDFWQLCKVFMQSFVDLVTDMREVRNMQLLPPDIVTILRPVQKASREAGRLIETSPWSYFADVPAAPHIPYVYGPPLQTSQHHPSSSAPAPYLSSSGRLPGASPQSSAIPATPLSAALGPAVQATIPSTPASAYSDRFFAGDVFQRADTLLSMNQAPYLHRR